MNLGLARRFKLPTTVVGDIDRGGVFAALYGTCGLLDDADRALITSFVINKFRGDRSVLEPGLTELTRRTGVPFAGVLPWLADVWLDAEDTLQLGWRRRSEDSANLRVAVVRLPRVSNATDVDALAAEPGVDVVVTTDPGIVAGADVAVLPGSRATVSDLGWLQDRGLARVIEQRARRGAPVLGICGGYRCWRDDLRRRGGGRRPEGRTRSAARADHLRGGRGPGSAVGPRRGHPVTGTRSITGWRGAPGVSPSWTAPGRSGLGHHVARRWRTTRSAGPG